MRNDRKGRGRRSGSKRASAKKEEEPIEEEEEASPASEGEVQVFPEVFWGEAEETPPVPTVGEVKDEEEFEVVLNGDDAAPEASKRECIGGPTQGKKKVLLIDEEEEEEEEEPDFDYIHFDEELTAAADEEEPAWDDIEVVEWADPVLLMKCVINQAWKDGQVTEDEMGLLKVLAERLGLGEDELEGLLNDQKPPEEVVRTEENADQNGTPLGDIDIMEIPKANGPWMEKEPPHEDHVPILSDPCPPPVQETLETAHSPDLSGIGRPTDMITLRTPVRGDVPLSRSFDLSHEERGPIIRRCPSCRAQIKLKSLQGIVKCPICGGRIGAEAKASEGLRKVLDMAKNAYKGGNVSLAKELYSTALSSSPGNKEAMFYLQKIGKASPAMKRIDLSGITVLPFDNHRLDSLLKGGIEIGSQVLFIGPPFCGKDLIIESLMASSMKMGLPVIYVSSNRAMKEVVKGITDRLPEFREYNREGRVRMFDLFSKHSDDIVLKEGHRIFNIMDKNDFLRFQNDLIMVLEEFMRTYGTGLLIISSLSPLINQVEQTDLMKFLQVLIARSKSYRFTNIFDMASNVHPDTVVNSIEYIMDGIAEFREKDNKNSLRLKGFKRGVVTKDWIEYACEGRNISLTSSFHEQRII